MILYETIIEREQEEKIEKEIIEQRRLSQLQSTIGSILAKKGKAPKPKDFMPKLDLIRSWYDPDFEYNPSKQVKLSDFGNKEQLYAYLEEKKTKD